MHKSTMRWLAVGVLVSGATGAYADLYRYINDEGTTVLDSGVPPQFISRGYEVLDAGGRVKLIVPPVPTREEREATQQARQDQARRDTADATLLRLYASVSDMDRAHSRQIQQIDNLITTSEAGILTLVAQRSELQSRAAAQERAGREVGQHILKQLQEIDAEHRRLERLITGKREEILQVNSHFARQRERLAALLTD